MVQTMDLELVYRACFTKVYNYFFCRLLHREAAEDLTSQTFLRMVERFHTYDTGRGQIEPWLFRIAERVLIDYYREKKRLSPWTATRCWNQASPLRRNIGSLSRPGVKPSIGR